MSYLWKIKKDSFSVEEVAHLSEFLRVHPVIARLLLKRGLRSEQSATDFLLADYDQGIYDPFLFSQMEKAVERIRIAREKGERVMVFGDYDADGITSSVILKKTLDDLGVENFNYIPDKNKEGYGLNVNAIREFKKKNISLIITVDCGITGVEETRQARQLGIDVIITDHHHIPPILPEANAIINPKIKNSGYPFADLAGVGVAFKLAQAIYRKLMPEKEEQTKWFLDLVAIGTVADCVPLIDENRVLVKYGLIVLSKTRRVGLGEIFQTGRISVDENNFPDTRKISFQIAPRINAAGRIDHADLAYNLLTETDRARARLFALEIEAQNKKRQKDTEQVVKEIEKITLNSFKDKKLIFAVSPHFPVGIVGLAAGKIAEKFALPTGVFFKNENESKGSFRSARGFNIIEAIEKCGSLLERYGGHSQAAGVSVKNENLEMFYQCLNAIVEEELSLEKIEPELEIDLELAWNEINFQLADDLKKMEPFGEGNPVPIFLARNLVVQEVKKLGNGEKHLKLFLRAQNNAPEIREAIGFGLVEKFFTLKTGDRVDLVFELEKDQWNGREKLQLKIKDLKLAERT